MQSGEEMRQGRTKWGQGKEEVVTGKGGSRTWEGSSGDRKVERGFYFSFDYSTKF